MYLRSTTDISTRGDFSEKRMTTKKHVPTSEPRPRVLRVRHRCRSGRVRHRASVHGRRRNFQLTTLGHALQDPNKWGVLELLLRLQQANEQHRSHAESVGDRVGLGVPLRNSSGRPTADGAARADGVDHDVAGFGLCAVRVSHTCVATVCARDRAHARQHVRELVSIIRRGYRWWASACLLQRCWC